MFKSILSKGFTFLLVGVSIALFYERSFFIGTLALIWGISRLFGYNLKNLVTNIGQVNRLAEMEKKSNCYMEFQFNVAKVVEHPAVDALYERLTGKNLVNESRDDWRKKIVSNYKKKFKKEDSLEVVKFNIKNNVLWKNGAAHFIDSIYHDIFIPYDANAEENEYDQHVDKGLTLRVFIVNARVKLQIGDFPKELSPKVPRDGFLSVYQRYQTITSFPMLNYCYLSGIPEHYLNISARSTDWWWAKGDDRKLINDWTDLSQDLRDYYQLVNATNDDFINADGKFKALIKRLKDSGDVILKKEGFKDPYAREGKEDYHDDMFDTNDVHYRNNYLTIFISNLNDLKEKREEFLYPDFWEDRP